MKSAETSEPRVTIVVARLVEDFEVVGESRIDLGERPKLRQIKRPEACCWLNQGTRGDVAKAKSWATANGYSVFTFASPEPDTLGKARAMLLERCSKESTELSKKKVAARSRIGQGI